MWCIVCITVPTSLCMAAWKCFALSSNVDRLASQHSAVLCCFTAVTLSNKNKIQQFRECMGKCPQRDNFTSRSWRYLDALIWSEVLLQQLFHISVVLNSQLWLFDFVGLFIRIIPEKSSAIKIWTLLVYQRNFNKWTGQDNLRFFRYTKGAL